MTVKPVSNSFPEGFYWGAATAGHQIEGNNVNSDYWVLENVRPTLFKEPSGDACNSFALWRDDLDLAKAMGLNAYRFSIEWSRIEPEPGLFSIAMLDHYKRIIEGCRQRGLAPMVTFSHWTVPRWFAAQGSWLHADSDEFFARYCDHAMRHLGDEIAIAVTLNEPNGLLIAHALVPAQTIAAEQAMQAAAKRATGEPQFVGGHAFAEIVDMLPKMQAAHVKGTAAIKAVRSGLPVGATLALIDEVALAGGLQKRDEMRRVFYGDWLDTLKNDDFIGVQNYHRNHWNSSGIVPPSGGALISDAGLEINAGSLANTVRYVHGVTGRPILVTEHGYYVVDDAIRASQLPLALAELKRAIYDGIPVFGYVHWSLLDNFEWTDGYGSKLGLAAVDRANFVRTRKPSARVYQDIAQHNRVDLGS